MAVAVRTPIIQTPPEGINFLRSSHIPFSGPNVAFTTSFQADFGSFSSPPCRTPAVPHPTPAQVEHRDVGNIKEFRTESGDSFQQRPQQQVTKRGQTPAWTKLTTNFKMHADPREVTELSVQSHSYTPPHTSTLSTEVTELTDPQSYPPPHPSRLSLSRELKVQAQSYTPQPSTRPSEPHPARAFMWSRAEEKLPESTHRASFTPLCVSPVVKASAKHLERCCTVKGDSRGDSAVSHYGDTFRGQCQPPPQPVDKQSSSYVPMGDQVKTIERETTHAAAFTHTAVSGENSRSTSSRRSGAAVTLRWKVNLGDDFKEPWSSTSREAFGDTGRSGAVHLSRRNRNLSCVPRGDTHQGRNRDMMSATTNRFFFSERNQRERPVHVSGADLRTKSNVEFGGSGLRDQYFKTTIQDHYPWRGGDRATTCTWTPGWALSGDDPGPVYSTIQADFTPPQQTCRQTLNPQHLDMMKESHIRAPCDQHHFSTTHTDSFQLKPLSCVSPLDRHKQYRTHFIL